MNKIIRSVVSVICAIVLSVATIAVIPTKVFAYNTGDDYPAKYKNAEKDAIADEWRFYNRECTSFVAWCLNSRNGVAFNNSYGGKGTWGNANNWVTMAQKNGIAVDYNPAVGSVGCSTSGPYGHVVWVKSVDGNNVVIEEYNNSGATGGVKGVFSTRTVSKTAYQWIHIKDISHTHDYTQCTVSKAPTATANGTWTLKCSCGDTTTETIPKIPDANIRDGIYRIAAKTDSSMYVSVAPYQSYQEGNIALYKRGVADQDFGFKKNSDGTYTITYGSFVLDVCGGNYQGTVWLYSSNGSDAQKWYVVSAGNGYYRLVNKALYLNLDICGNWMDPGTDIRSWIHNGSDAQIFKLELIECANHTWDKGTVIKQPGIGTTGTMKYTCTACGKTKTETIPALISVNDLTVKVDDATYIGSAVKPTVKVTYNSKTLVEGTDYTLSYSDNNKVGTGKVTVTGKGSYSGTKTVNFKINEPTYSWKSVSGNWYLYDNTGRKITGFITLDGSTYYLDGSGVMLKEWQQINGAWYYFGGSGVMRKGWQQIGGSWYYFDKNGKMMKDWQQIGGVWYYFGESGSMKTGWQKISGSWYYFESSGHMAKGWQKISNVWYYFGDSGIMRTGWQKIDGKWYYFASSGAMQTGWLNLSGKWYWLGTDGSMAYSTGVSINGKTYYFDSNGTCLNP